jgi:hypothetical protein
VQAKQLGWKAGSHLSHSYEPVIDILSLAPVIAYFGIAIDVIVMLDL